MEAICGRSLQCSTWFGSKISVRKSNSLLPISKVVNHSDNLQPQHASTSWQSSHCVEISHPDKSLQALKQRMDCASFEGKWFLKTKGQEIGSRLNGRCIYLVGMMGSGKTTVGKILSEALGYTFVDSDSYVENAMGGTSITQIFKQCGESFFREYESEALQKLSQMRCRVIATGGGAVIRAVNWEYMKHGISVYLKVPVDALARRIGAVGNNSRPLLDDSGDAYTKAFVGLFPLSRKRADAYANADITVALSDIATNLGGEDVLDVTPAAIATEVILQIEKFLGGTTSTSVHVLP